MARYPGGTEVSPGYYWNLRTWTLTSVSDGGALPGDASESYRRIHWAAALLLAPVLGGLFVVFMPFVGAAMLIHRIAAGAAGGARRGAKDLAATVTPGWRPGEAHLTGRGAKPPTDDAAGGGAGQEALNEVAEEIAHKRAGERNNGD